MNVPHGIPPWQYWKDICPTAQIIHKADCDLIYRQGAQHSSLYIIVAGHIKLTRVSSEGDEHVVAILSAGELLGQPFDVNEQTSMSHMASAKGDVELYTLPASAMHSLFTDECISGFIIQSLIKRQRFYESRISSLLGQNVRQRVAATLVELCTHYGGRCPHGHEVDIRLTQQELAEMVGASRPVVSACINKLRSDGLISYTREFICIENLEVFRRTIE